MDPVAALILIAAVMLTAMAIGLVLRRREGRARAARGPAAVDPAGLDLAGAAFGERATLLQFSTEYCARCPAARRVLGRIAGEHEGVAHVDVDLTHRPDLTRRFGVLQTPTTLVVDAHGAVRARIGGAPRVHDVERELERILEDSRV
ncbi:thioredoxin family protein [Microbacterium sp. NPDC096154]|uniref:TlpA family protein disulfide reductase n=1 Tax=Microbacterium sp. NPDC096154 TaxID=3155549 RepID=UPI00332605F6